MPLPEFGELVIHPAGSEWATAGEICGVRIVGQVHESQNDAFEYLETLMERDGRDIIAAAKAEQQCPYQDRTLLQEALLTNLLGYRAAQAAKSRDEAEFLIESFYPCEYDRSAETNPGIKGDAYADALAERFRLDFSAINACIDSVNEL